MGVGEKGVCRLAVIPMRTSGSDKAEIISQLLFGDHYEVLLVSEDAKWLKVRLHFDGYEGWIDEKQHTFISDAYFEQINNADYKICTDLTSSILYKKHHITIVIGSVLPIATNELFKVEEQLAFNGEAKSLSQKRDFEFLSNLAKKYLNAPYLWGGRSPFGIDCSGFVQNVFRMCGYRLKRDSGQQALAGTVVNHISEAEGGDLAFFSNESGVVNHVGIVLGKGEIIHASGMVRIDKITKEGIINVESGQLTHRLLVIKRVMSLP